MADTRPFPSKEQITFDREPPALFKVGRDAALQLSKVERNLFTDMEEKESGNYIISGLTKQVSELDFTAFTFAVGQILYNQSYQSHNEDINSGINRSKANKISRQLGTDTYKGEIVVILNELCRLAYGEEPSTKSKKKMVALIETFHNTPVKVKFPNGDEIESVICARMGRYTRKEDGATLYNLFLNPIFSSRIQNQFGEFPQDVIARLDYACKEKNQRKSAADYLLLRWLSVQDKRHPHTLTIDTIIEELRMEEQFRKSRSRTETQLLSICDRMRDVGILDRYEVKYSTSDKRKRIQRITFHLNKSFVRPFKGEKELPGE